MRLVPHPSGLMTEEPPPSSPSYLLSDLAAFQLLRTPRRAIAVSVLANSSLPKRTENEEIGYILDRINRQMASPRPAVTRGLFQGP
ncbi:hypothetical protein GRJ2_001802800 [Grus japonensis]|uniref:Uncharacterized protein n=1 Tax=Grus japonensis TaxID=30415 RepID=A0ABC9X6R7_GRUJA